MGWLTGRQMRLNRTLQTQRILIIVTHPGHPLLLFGSMNHGPVRGRWDSFQAALRRQG